MATRPGYIWSGTEWVSIGQEAVLAPISYQTSAPSSPATGDVWIDSNDDVPSVNSTLYYRWKKTATGGETSFTGTDDNSLTLAYTAGYESVFINGVLQVRGSDYTATTGTSITGLTALTAGDIVMVESVMAYSVGDTYTQSQMTSLLGGKSDVSTTGLVLLNTTTIGSAVSSITISNCFSATYQNYLITLNGTVGSQQGTLGIKFNNSTGSTYKRNGYYQTYASTTVSGDVGTGGTSSYIGMYNTVMGNFTSTIYSPFLTSRTALTSQYATDIEAGVWNGYDTNSASNTGFILTASAGTVTGGTIEVYGYK